MSKANSLLPIEVSPTVQQYAWGRDKKNSIISSLISQSLAASLDSGPLAELWIGAHPKASAKIAHNFCSLAGVSIAAGTSLIELFKATPSLLGERIVSTYGTSLPYLFKVLSIAEPLSIQLHPDAETAVAMHREDPEHYPDSNPKPEVGVALEETKLLYGFRSVDELRDLFSIATQVGEAVGVSECIDQLRIDKMFPLIYSLSTEQLSKCCQQLYRLSAQDKLGDEDSRWLKYFSQRYPTGDVGVLAFCFLNVVTLEPGEALFIAPNVPHAYLSGEIVECMANSDNVVRAGLTPKFSDVNRLLSMVDYSAGLAELCRTEKESSGFSRYLVPARQFSLSRFLGSGESSLSDSGSLTLLFCLSGQATLTSSDSKCLLGRGTALVVPAGVSAKLTTDAADIFRVVVGN